MSEDRHDEEEPELFRDGESILSMLAHSPDFPYLEEIGPGRYWESKLYPRRTDQHFREDPGA